MSNFNIGLLTKEEQDLFIRLPKQTQDQITPKLVECVTRDQLVEKMIAELGGLEDATEFWIEDQGSKYSLPIYSIDDDGIKRTDDTYDLLFVRGSKREQDHIERMDGVIHESLLSSIIWDLEYKNSLVSSEQTSEAIRHLRNALDLIRSRALTRLLRGVVGTYQK